MFQASHRKLAYVVCGQNRRRLLEASMGWYIRHHWHGMVWYGMAWQGTVKYDMVWQGMVCVDTSVTIAKTMSVIVIEDRSVARTIVLIQRFWKHHVLAERIAEVANAMWQNGHISWNSESVAAQKWSFIEHVFAQTFFHLSLATQFGRHSWQGVGKGLEHRHWLPGARGARGALLIAQLNWLVNFAFLYLLTIEAHSH